MNTTTDPQLGAGFDYGSYPSLFLEAHAYSLERMNCPAILVLPFPPFLCEQAFNKHLHDPSIHPSGSGVRVILSRGIDDFFRQITTTSLVRLLFGFQKNPDSSMRESVKRAIVKIKEQRRSRSLGVVKQGGRISILIWCLNGGVFLVYLLPL